MLDILIALGAGLGGIACGWCMRSNLGNQSDSAETKVTDASVDGLAPNGELTQKSVYNVAEKVRALSKRIAADVDEHQSRVQQANLALTDGDAVSDPDAIVSVVTQLIQANQTMQNQLQEAQQRIQDQAAQIQTAEERAVTDALTSIRNRRAFDDFLEKCYADRHDSPSTLMLLDVDHFKNFNDQFGHLAGDEVLRNVASILEARLGEMGLVARYGGEEFAVIFENCKMEACQGAVELARRIIGEREIDFEGQRLSVTASLGLAQVDVNESLEGWVERVDQGLYKAKEMGRNRGYWMDGTEPQPLLEADTGADTSAEQMKTNARPSLHSSATHKRKVDGKGMENALDHQFIPPFLNHERQLHDRESLGAVFAAMSERLKVIEVSLYVMIVRADRVDLDAGRRRDVLFCICSVTRSLAQIGVLENGDFVVCMPAATKQAALQRAHAIREAVEQASGANIEEMVTASIGLSLVCQGDSFESMLAAAGSAVDEAVAQGGGQVVIDRCQPDKHVAGGIPC